MKNKMWQQHGQFKATCIKEVSFNQKNKQQQSGLKTIVKIY